VPGARLGARYKESYTVQVRSFTKKLPETHTISTVVDTEYKYTSQMEALLLFIGLKFTQQSEPETNPRRQESSNQPPAPKLLTKVTSAERHWMVVQGYIPG